MRTDRPRRSILAGLAVVLVLAALSSVEALAVVKSYHTETGGNWSCGSAARGMTGILTAEPGYVCANDSLYLNYMEGTAATWVLTEPSAQETMVRGGELSLAAEEHDGDNDLQLELAYTTDGAVFTTLGYADASVGASGTSTFDLGGISGVAPAGSRLALRILSLASDLTLRFGTVATPAGSVRLTVNEEVPCSDPVGNLAAVASTGTTVELAWDPAFRADAYYIYRNAAPDPVATVSVPGFTDTAVSGQAGYSYEVRAYNAVANCLTPGAALAVTTPPFSVDYPSFDYGEVLAPGSSPREFTITNRRSLGTAAVASATLSGTEAARFAVTANGCTGVNLAPGATCGITVTFTPDREGDREAVLTVTPSGPAPVPLSIPLRGGLRMGPSLVADMRPGQGNFSPIQPVALAKGGFVFSADDGVHHAEPWVSDGTTSGTRLLRDINAGWGSSPHSFALSGKTLYFVADDGIHGAELWRTDGTQKGTVMVKDVFPGSAPSNPANLTAWGSGGIFFTADDGAHGVEVWKSDGTTHGTRIVADLVRGPTSSSPSQLVVSDDVLYFVVGGRDLWRSDGFLGTRLVTSLTSIQYLTDLRGTLFFAGNNGTAGVELWKSTGTASGTAPVRDIYAGASSSSPTYLTPVGTTLYFTATNGTTNGRELWKSNGTSAGTVLVKDIYAGSASSFPSYLTADVSALYFWANDGVNGIELWRSGGTSATTNMVVNIAPGSQGSSTVSLVRLGSKFYFMADNGTGGYELWVTDGTTAGTFAVRDVNGSASTYPSNFIVSGETLYFRAWENATGYELWKYIPNTPPSATWITSGQVGYNGETIGPLGFTVGDTQSDPGDLTVTAVSSNQTLLPNAGILVGGSGANRTLTLTPAAGQRGTATVTYTVSDGVNTTSRNFDVSWWNILKVPATYATIQSAVDAALAGDTVLVADGTYTGTGNRNIDFKGKGITLRSENGPAHTVVDCEHVAGTYGVVFVTGETASAVLEGFTIVRAFGGIGILNASPRIVNCVFTANSLGADVRGATTARFEGCHFIDNALSEAGAAMVESLGSVSSPVFSACRFAGNSGGNSGAIHAFRVTTLTVEDCLFEDNVSQQNATVTVDIGALKVSRSRFTHNVSQSYGGAIDVSDSSAGPLTVDNSVFIGNRAEHGGGAIHARDATIVNCTVFSNSARIGGGAYLYGTSQIVNSIFWGNKDGGENAQVVNRSSTTLAVSHSAVEGGALGIVNGGSGSVATDTILSADPQLALTGEPRLLPDSPCIDAGTNSPPGGLAATDLAGGPRLQNGTVDLGAFEQTADPDAPIAAVSPASLLFKAVKGGTIPDTGKLFIRNSGGGDLAWEVASDVAWMRVEPAEGDSTGETDTVLVAVDHSSLERGFYTGSLLVTDPTTGATLRTVYATLYVSAELHFPEDYATIQAAIDAAYEGEVVSVAAGTWRGAGNKELDYRGKAITVRSEDGPLATIIDCEGSGTGFVFNDGESSEAVVQGFTIQNATRGMTVSSGSPRISNCRFVNNPGGGYGAGLYISSSYVVVSNCEFINNAAQYGGGAAVAAGGSHNAFSKCTFTGNSAVNHGGGLYLGTFPNFVDDCTFTNNVAGTAPGSHFGGGIYVGSGSVDDGISIRNCTFEGNKAEAGGGIYSADPRTIIANGVFWKNYACDSVAGTTCNNVHAIEQGGGVFTAGGFVYNSTFAANWAGSSGGGLYLAGSADPCTAANSVFVDNIARMLEGDEVGQAGSSNRLTYSALDKRGDTPPALESGFNNVDLGVYDPLFVNRAGGNFRIDKASPLVDAGKTIDWIFSDRRGSLRAVDGDGDGFPKFDIGAYEYSEYYGRFLEDVTTRAFKDLRINGSLVVTNFEYRIEWRDKDPFPYDARIKQSQEYGIRLALVDAGGLRVELGEWTVPASQIGYTIPYVFGQQHIGTWRIRLELASDPNQYVLSSQIQIQYKQAQTYYMGQWIAPPQDANPTLKPDWDNAKACYWSADTNRLYAVGPYTTIITWYGDAEHTVAIPTLAYITYPAPQIHVPGTPTVRILPEGTRFESATLVWTDGDAKINGTDFNATIEGWSTILYRDTQGVTPEEREVFEVVRTLSWDHYNPLLPGDPVFPVEPVRGEGTDWTIGTLVTDAEHEQVACGSGYIFFEMAYYDGAGGKKAYDRRRRTGRIFAVNEDDPATEEDDLVVVWYQKSKVADGCWPFKPGRYNPVWPAGTSVCNTGNLTSCDRIVIASQQGSGPLPPSVYGQQESMLLYDQRDRGLPGFNPNEEHAMLFAAQGSQYPAAFALRTDLNHTLRSRPDYTSRPCVLLKYVEPVTGEWNMRAFMVTPEVAPDLTFSYPGTAGNEINPPYPLSQMVFGPCEESATITPDEVHRDKDKKFFAKAGPIAGSPVWSDGNPYMPVNLRYFYRLQPAFHLDRDDNGVQDELPATCIPWLDWADGIPVDIGYRIAWPPEVPTLFVGETLTDAKTQQNEPVGLPNIKDQCVARILYDQSDAEHRGRRSAKFIDPLKEYGIPLNPSALAGLRTNRGPDGRIMFIDLPYHIQMRLTYDEVDTGGPPNFFGKLKLRGKYITGTGEAMLLLNALAQRELEVIEDLQGALQAFKDAVAALALLGEAGLAGSTTIKDAALKALTAGAARGTGYMTLAFNDDVDCNAPTMTSVVKVGCPLYRGELKVIESANPFEEKLTLRHNGDFGGGSDQRWFQWMYRVANFSGIPESPPDDPKVVSSLWQPWSDVQPVDEANDPGYPPDRADPDPRLTGGNLWYKRANDTTIQGSGQQLLPDKWFAARYYYDGICGEPISRWTEPQLYEGWLKRVMKKINLYDQRISDFRLGEVNTLADMLSQAGRRYEGDAALNDDPDYIQNVGLIELYETLLRRARNLSIDGTPRVNLTDLNKAILFAANRLAGLYALLGNEAYADAADPTIGFSTADGVYGTEAPSIFAFQNQVDSLLEEELTLLRGRPDEGSQPFYNRLLWNFTIDDGEVAYRENFNITDQNGDGRIDERDAMILHPQGHGDAWGHYLMALKKYYGLITHDYYTWEPQSEAILVEQTPVSVDFRDERRFATVAAAKARAGSEIVTLAYREYYEEDPERQWQGYKDDDRDRAWGLAEWASRAGQGAYFDWVVGNALLPPESPADHLETLPRTCSAGQRRFVIDSDVYYSADFYRNSLRVTVNSVAQDPAAYAVTQEYDGFNRDWDTVVTFFSSPCPAFATTISFRADVQPEGIQRIDRVRVTELQEIPAQYALIQATLDDADAGLNPLGVAKDSVPFDIDPARVAQGETHFEQVYGRAAQAMNNAIAVFNHANQNTQLLRRQQDRLGDFQRNVVNAEADYNSRLIEIFGTPYPDDCGVGKTYSAAECNTVPDLYHYMYVDSTDLHKEMQMTLYTVPVNFTVQKIDAGGVLTVENTHVLYHLAAGGTYGVRKPHTWYGLRKAPGEIQVAYAELLRARTKLQAEVNNYSDAITKMVDDSKDLVRLWSKEDIQQQIELTELGEQRSKDEFLRTGKEILLGFQTASRLATFIADAVAEGTPKCIGLIAGVASGTVSDILSGVRAAAMATGNAVAEIAGIQRDIQDVVITEIEAAKQIMRDERNLALKEEEKAYTREKAIRDFERAIRHEASRRDAVFVAIEEVQQAGRRVQAVLARGERLAADQLRFRQQTAAQTQEYRYKDMTFRIFRNDALQKYKAQFELAARYVYLAAKAYDYETTLLDSNSMAGQNFLRDIVRQRAIGMIENGQPLTGTGLADPMRRMWQNFQVLKPQLGFDNPQQETNRFSLRRELLRVGTSAGSDDTWRAALKSFRVDDIWQVPEFRRYCRPFSEAGIPEPGLVIPFRTTVTSGLNFFAWPLAGGDSYYSASNFATKVRSVGIWFSNYNATGLAQTPRVYLVPVGQDVLRTPGQGVSDIRTWDVVDQKVPVPFPLNPTEMENDAGWIPLVDTLNDEMFQIRRHSDFKAYHDSGYFDPTEMIYDTRLIGRSVWNTRWLLIVPGRNLLYDPAVGLDRLIDGPEVLGGLGERTGYGISDIKLFFETYAYSGD